MVVMHRQAPVVITYTALSGVVFLYASWRLMVVVVRGEWKRGRECVCVCVSKGWQRERKGEAERGPSHPFEATAVMWHQP